MEEYYFDTMEDWDEESSYDEENFVDPYGTHEADEWWAGRD